MKEFFSNCKKYWNFCCYSARCQLNVEIVGMRLGWLWWLLEPALNMAIYTYVFTVVFGRKMDYLMAFIACGVMMWGFFQRTVLGSVGLVKRYTGLLNRVYMPKYILIISNIMLNAIKMFIAFLIVVYFIVFYYKIPLSFSMLQLIPVVAVLMVYTFAISIWMMHLGVYLPDLRKVCGVVLQVCFYASGVFYSIGDRLEGVMATIMLDMNPVAWLMQEARNVLIYGLNCSVEGLCRWLIVGVVVAFAGIKTVTHCEKNYLKVI